jgi:hypothetical protein
MDDSQDETIKSINEGANCFEAGTVQKLKFVCISKEACPDEDEDVVVVLKAVVEISYYYYSFISVKFSIFILWCLFSN